MKILTEISARHAHLSEEDFKKLFGKNAKLKIIKKLSQPGEFASDKIIKLKNKKIRIVGPLRKYSQIEISKTDAIELKINPPLRLSGDLKGVKKITIKKDVKIPVIIAKRHLHLSEKEAKKLKIKNNQKVKIKINSKKGLIFENIITRVGKDYKSAFHIDTDEGNAAGIKNKTFGKIIK